MLGVKGERNCNDVTGIGEGLGSIRQCCKVLRIPT